MKSGSGTHTWVQCVFSRKHYGYFGNVTYRLDNQGCTGHLVQWRGTKLGQ